MLRLDTNDIPKNKNEKTNEWYNKGKNSSRIS